MHICRNKIESIENENDFEWITNLEAVQQLELLKQAKNTSKKRLRKYADKIFSPSFAIKTKLDTELAKLTFARVIN